MGSAEFAFVLAFVYVDEVGTLRRRSVTEFIRSAKPIMDALVALYERVKISDCNSTTKLYFNGEFLDYIHDNTTFP